MFEVARARIFFFPPHDRLAGHADGEPPTAAGRSEGLDLCSTDLVYAQRTWFMLNGPDLCSTDLIYAQQTWFMLNGPGLCSTDLGFVLNGRGLCSTGLGPLPMRERLKTPRVPSPEWPTARRFAVGVLRQKKRRAALGRSPCSRAWPAHPPRPHRALRRLCRACLCTTDWVNAQRTGWRRLCRAR